MLLSAVVFAFISAGYVLAEDKPMRLERPRIGPLIEAEWSGEQRRLLEPLQQQGRLYNVFTTFARHPALFERFRVFGGYVLRGSALPPRDREILILRAGWLCQAPYEWAQHARIAKTVGLSDAEIRRIAEGPRAEGWSRFDSTLLRTADELHDDTIISDETWRALSEHYSTQQLMDAILTVGEYHLVSMALNSFGVQLDDGLAERLPTDIDLPARTKAKTQPQSAESRVPPLADSQLSDEQRTTLQAVRRDDGSVLNLYRTLVHHPKMFMPRYTFGSYLRSETTLPARDREILILRIAWLCRAEYEWGHHKRIGREAGLTDAEIQRIAKGPDAAGWEAFDASLLRAVDELHEGAFISNATWKVLAARYDTPQLMDAVFTVGGYKMLAMVLNSCGVELDPGVEGFVE